MFHNVGTHTEETTTQEGESNEDFGIDLQMIFVVCFFSLL